MEKSNNKTILLVEDEPIVTAIERKMLTKHGFVVITAVDAEEAIAAAGTKSIDLILMDIDLGIGKMDGTEAARIILRENNLPLVFCTSHTEKAIVEKVKGISQYGYVIKNSGEFVLIEAIHTAFALFDAHEQLMQKEDKLIKINRTLRTISECNKILVHSQDEYHLVRDICSAIVEKAGYIFVWVGYAGDDAPRTVLPIAHAGREDGYLATLSICIDEGPSSKGPTAAAFRNGEPAIISEILKYPDYGPWRKDAAERGFKSSIALPLKNNTNVFGVLNIYAAEADAFSDEEVQLLQGLSEDLSYGIHNIRTLRENEERKNLFDNILENLPIGLQIFDQNGYSYKVNKRQKELLGLPDTEEGIGKFNVFTDPYSVEHGADKLYRRAYNGESLKDMENKYNFDIAANEWNTRKGVRYFSESIFPIFDRQKNVRYAVALLADITRRKMTEFALKESEARWNFALEGSRSGVWDWDIETGEVFFSAQWKLMLGYEENEIGDSISERDIRIHPEDKEQCYLDLEDHLQGDKPFYENEHRMLCKSGGYKWVLDRGMVVNRREDEKPLRVIGTQTDITDLKNALEEKDFLLKELNHRIKNNLSLIKSLVSLKNSELPEEIDFSDVYNQIEAIRLVHQKLYQSDKIKSIEFADYVHDLCTTIFSSYIKDPVTLEFAIDPIAIPTSKAIPLGLIVNEIATNAIKHGFSAEGGTWFSIRLDRGEEDGKYLLTMSNSGNPFPENVDFSNPGTLGLRLIKALVDQIHGTVELIRKPFPVFKIRFQLEKK